MPFEVKYVPSDSDSDIEHVQSGETHPDPPVQYPLLNNQGTPVTPATPTAPVTPVNYSPGYYWRHPNNQQPPVPPMPPMPPVPPMPPLASSVPFPRPPFRQVPPHGYNVPFPPPAIPPVPPHPQSIPVPTPPMPPTMAADSNTIYYFNPRTGQYTAAPISAEELEKKQAHQAKKEERRREKEERKKSRYHLSTEAGERCSNNDGSRGLNLNFDSFGGFMQFLGSQFLGNNFNNGAQQRAPSRKVYTDEARSFDDIQSVVIKHPAERAAINNPDPKFKVTVLPSSDSKVTVVSEYFDDLYNRENVSYASLIKTVQAGSQLSIDVDPLSSLDIHCYTTVSVPSNVNIEFNTYAADIQVLANGLKFGQIQSKNDLGKLNLTNVVADDVIITQGAGAVAIDDLECNNLKIDSNLGRVTLTNTKDTKAQNFCRIFGNLFIKTELGAIDANCIFPNKTHAVLKSSAGSINAALTGYASLGLNSNLGTVNLVLDPSENSTNELSNDVGSVSVKLRNFFGILNAKSQVGSVSFDGQAIEKDLSRAFTESKLYARFGDRSDSMRIKTDVGAINIKRE